MSAATELRAALIINTHDQTVADRLPIRWAMTSGRLTQKAALSC